ncbi:peptidoglycan DD-metalloendopeptidase family protein, partial [Patulibacter defluvii]|uniref:peptidoglycan DD-metalloendopeptidase family protein n=1 Tax=Patulibacter defluvii TaxID=3095358 RepID=UPI002A74E5EF
MTGQQRDLVRDDLWQASHERSRQRRQRAIRGTSASEPSRLARRLEATAARPTHTATAIDLGPNGVASALAAAGVPASTGVGGRDLADPSLWQRSTVWARERRISVPIQRARERRRRKMAMAMSVAMVGSTTGPAVSGAIAAGATGDTATTTTDGSATTSGRIAGPISDEGRTRSILVAGATGQDVREAQQRLGVHVDGVYGERTVRAVERFQRQRGLQVDGVLGPQTWTALLSTQQASVRGAGAGGSSLKVVAARTSADGGQDLVLVGPSERAATTRTAALTDDDRSPSSTAASDEAAATSDSGSGSDSGTGSGSGSGAGSSSSDGAASTATGDGGSKDAAKSTGGGETSSDREASPKADTPTDTGSGSSSTGSTSGTAKPISGTVTSPYGARWGRQHAGMDIAAAIGTPIKAYAAGTVAFSGTQSGYGNIVCVDHGDGLQTCYAHMSKNAVRQGAKVQAGDVVGYVGMTGRTTGPHLHFEVRKNGKAVDPAPYYSGAGKASSRSTTTAGSGSTTTKTAAKTTSGTQLQKASARTSSAALASGGTQIGVDANAAGAVTAENQATPATAPVAAEQAAAAPAAEAQATSAPVAEAPPAVAEAEAAEAPAATPAPEASAPSPEPVAEAPAP